MLIIIAVMLTTMFIRFFPFIAVRGEVPAIVKYLGNSLQYATMAMLVVYCLKTPLSTSIFSYNMKSGIPEILAIILIVTSYKLKHNTLLSIVLGTALYVILIN